MKFLITGANGQLARSFLRKFKENKSDVSAFGRETLDISDSHAVVSVISQYTPDIVINCAAYNYVDDAEKNFEAAFKVNAEGVRNLATACKKSNALLVHYSTDYIFDGAKEDFYTEDDEPNPVNSYGKSKLEGEQFLMEATDNFLLFRVSWMFGEGKQNFLYKLSEWAMKNRVLRIVCDQVSVPTYSEDVVSFSICAIKEKLRGIYNLTNSGYASRYEVSHYFTEKSGLNNIVLPVSSDYFPLPAKRPSFSAMSNSKLSKG